MGKSISPDNVLVTRWDGEGFYGSAGRGIMYNRIRVLHVANLGLTLQRFVVPLAQSSNDVQFEHLYAHSSPACGIDASTIHLSFGRSKVGILNAWRHAKNNAELILSVNPDIVHIHTPAAAISLITSLRKVKKNGIKVVYTARGSFDEGGNMTRRVLWHFLDPLKWRIWDGICVINDHLLAIAEASPKRVHRKISVGAAAPNWDSTIQSDAPRGKSQNGDPLRLVWVGRLAKEKRLQDFISLVTVLDKSLPMGCIGEVIGASLEGDGKEIHVSHSDNLVFHGWVESPTKIISRCDALISTSIREGYGLAPLEAALVGTPTFAVANHGTRESVPVIGGRLVRPNKPLELMEAVIAFAETTPEWKSDNRARVQQLATIYMEKSDPKAEMIDFYCEIASR